MFTSLFTPLERWSGLQGAAYLVGSCFLSLPLLLLLATSLAKRCLLNTHLKKDDLAVKNEGYQKDDRDSERETI